MVDLTIPIASNRSRSELAQARQQHPGKYNLRKGNFFAFFFFLSVCLHFVKWSNQLVRRAKAIAHTVPHVWCQSEKIDSEKKIVFAFFGVLLLRRGPSRRLASAPAAARARRRRDSFLHNENCNICNCAYVGVTCMLCTSETSSNFFETSSAALGKQRNLGIRISI
jgi:hypothetical protein